MCVFFLSRLDGYIVCTEFQDVLLDAWEKDQIEIEAKRKEVFLSLAILNCNTCKQFARGD